MKPLTTTTLTVLLLTLGWGGGSNEIHNTKAGGDNITLGFNINNDAVSNYNNKQNEFLLIIVRVILPIIKLVVITTIIVNLTVSTLS